MGLSRWALVRAHDHTPGSPLLRAQVPQTLSSNLGNTTRALQQPLPRCSTQSWGTGSHDPLALVELDQLDPPMESAAGRHSDEGYQALHRPQKKNNSRIQKLSVALFS